MMENLPPNDDPLARAEEALRRTSVPDGPSAETVGRILDALQKAKPGSRILRWPIPRTLRSVPRLVAAAVFVAALCSTAIFLIHQQALAFSDVAQRLRDAHRLRYRMTITSSRMKGAMVFRQLFQEPGLVRTEGEDGHVAIHNLRQGKTLILQPASRSALLLEMTPKPDTPPRPSADGGVQWLEWLRSLAEKEGEPAGRKRVGHAEALGFRVHDGDFDEMIVWADPKTRQPLLIEGTIRIGDRRDHIAISDFEIDPALDEDLFRLEAPAGYTLRKMTTELLNPAEDVAHVLGTYADTHGGTFPRQLDDLGAYEPLFSRMNVRGLPDLEAIKLIQSLARIVRFVRDKKSEFGYEPDGVRRGDADKIIFWYRTPEADCYRVVYGDLRIGTVDQRPEEP
ncbi:MAG TPA: hypothetical protein VKU02_12880 [Gemmataceae bacterium]|nr:hypothetical protein [Gemmataceae bacterium]